MSYVGETVVRRCHVLIEPPLRGQVAIECPDCGMELFKVVERVEGATRQWCRRCTDKNREKRQWIFVFHSDAEEFISAVKLESTTIDLSYAIS